MANSAARRQLGRRRLRTLSSVACDGGDDPVGRYLADTMVFGVRDEEVARLVQRHTGRNGRRIPERQFQPRTCCWPVISRVTDLGASRDPSEYPAWGQLKNAIEIGAREIDVSRRVGCNA